ncbi:hypothetical protein DOTSEDRAFT_24779 [Dothistroma septosporum NZE10]|uniref:Survival Motor Neuron Gemin2-binding domain-containing protein n=1 Tax=Dothistroma septosporum (strain NZE10 / CBS 128990) TaxID=675120 RepID=N1PMY7_DOTSN|nr:hypothetical protein DOTSEDRAFT_24779 [Dothistroma septosporum NZE10]
MAAQENIELTHDELWDDSALVNSWDDAFAEYKKYHSLAAKGEKVDIEATQKHGATSSKSKAMPNGNTEQPHSAAPVNFINTPNSIAATTPAPATATAPVIGPALPPGLASLPQNLITPGQDENLKNIMMSWYYAGYYTGLYEGQQKAWAAMQEGG